MTEFILPFPTRHKKSLGPLDILKYASRDLLSIWPEVIRHVLVTNHANYEKKSPLLRKAFEPLLGDGMFISDGKTWQYRRNMEVPFFTAEQAA